MHKKLRYVHQPTIKFCRNIICTTRESEQRYLEVSLASSTFLEQNILIAGPIIYNGTPKEVRKSSTYLV